MFAAARVYIAAGCALLATVFSTVGVATPEWVKQSISFPEIGTVTSISGLFKAIARVGDMELVYSMDWSACAATMTGTSPFTGVPVDEVLPFDEEGTGICQWMQAVAAFTIIGIILSFAAFCASILTARFDSRPAMKTSGVVALVTASVCFVIATSIYAAKRQEALNLNVPGVAIEYGYSFALILVALFLDVIGAVFLYTYSSIKVAPINGDRFILIKDDTAAC